MWEFGKPPETPFEGDRPLYRYPQRADAESHADSQSRLSQRSANPMPLRSKKRLPPNQSLHSVPVSSSLGKPRSMPREKSKRRLGFLAFLTKLGSRKVSAPKDVRRESPSPRQSPRGDSLRSGAIAPRPVSPQRLTPDQRLQGVAPPPDRSPLRQRRERPVRNTPANVQAFSHAEVIKMPLRPRTKSGTALVYGTRLLILGIGVGVIAGTILSVWDPASRFMAGAQAGKKDPVAANKVSTPAVSELRFDQEILALKSDVQELVTHQSGLNVGVLFIDLDTNSYLDVNATQSFAAASTIKFPVLVAFFQDVDSGKIQLDEMLTMRKDLVTPESGEMQYQPVGSKFSALETANKMITISDNTATNILIDRLGGKEVLDQRFQSWGLTSTHIRNPLPDLEGTNTTSPRDMVTLMGMVNEGKLLSLRSRDRLLDIMRRTVNRSLLPKGLGEGAAIAHKTGDIGSMVGDIAMIDTPNGRRYLAAVLVKRPFNDDRAQELIRQISQTTYKYFSQPLDLTHARKAPNQGNSNQQIDSGTVKVAQPE